MEKTTSPENLETEVIEDVHEEVLRVLSNNGLTYKESVYIVSKTLAILCVFSTAGHYTETKKALENIYARMDQTIEDYILSNTLQ